MNDSNQNRNGYTLIEVLITAAVSVGILIIITMFGLDISRFGSTYDQSLEIQQEQELTLHSMAQELRGIGPADTGAYPVAIAGPGSLTFYSDYDGDGRFEQIRYFTAGTTLSRGVTISSGNPVTYSPANEKITEVTHDLTNPAAVFLYYDQNYTGTEAPLTVPVDIAKIRLVRVTLTADRDALSLPGPSTQNLNVTLRNFRTQ